MGQCAASSSFTLINYNLAFMLHSIQKINVWYYFHFADPRVADWFLMQSPLPTIAIAIIYLLTVWLGPKIMAKREAFDLHYFMVFYNFSCVLLGAHIVKEVNLPHYYICGHVGRYLYKHHSPVSFQHFHFSLSESEKNLSVNFFSSICPVSFSFNTEKCMLQCAKSVWIHILHETRLFYSISGLMR